jgi:host factor-I protein
VPILIEGLVIYKDIIEMTQNAQNDFLIDIKDNKIAVTVFLINGVKLQGMITWFDDSSLLLRRDGHTQLVYKHAISTIMPSLAVDVVDVVEG